MLDAVLKETNLPFDEIENQTEFILSEHSDVETEFFHRRFVLCIVFIFILLYNSSVDDRTSFHPLMKSLILAVKNGKISPIVVRAIIKMPKRKGIPIHPELERVCPV